MFLWTQIQEHQPWFWTHVPGRTLNLFQKVQTLSPVSMSCGGTATRAPKPSQSFRRAVQKVRCAGVVANLARGWQGWANQHSQKQDSIPSGWTPSSVDHCVRKEPKDGVTLTVTPRVAMADRLEPAGTQIRACSITKMVQPKRSECSSLDLVNAIRDKMESGPEDSRRYLGSESPTRRRHMRALQEGGGGGVIQERKLMLQEMRSGSRSSSVDTEDSGLGEDNGLSDNGEPKAVPEESQSREQTNKPKVTVANTNDIRSRWQQWTEQHIENQKLNPFSEDFDHDYAMAQRLRKGDSGYGRPKEGSMTAQRGHRAQKHIHREMEEMVWIIRDMGFPDRQGRTCVTFGRLFERYVKISDKVVGILLRCRKHKMVDFEGEMLWQGQDDHVVLTLRD